MTDDKLTKPADELRALMERAAHYGQSTITDATQKRYAAEFGQFRRWAEDKGLVALPAEIPTVVCYLAAMADGNVEVEWQNPRHKNPRVQVHRKTYKFATIRHTYTSIVQTHRAHGFEWPNEHPAITKVLRGIAHRIGTRKKKVQPMTVADLRKVILSLKERLTDDLRVIRDRSLLSLCFFGAFRRGELVALEARDLTFTDEGLIVLVRKSKMDQAGEGEEVGIVPQKDKRICPVALLKDWLTRGEVKDGPLYRRIDKHGCLGNRPLTGDAIADLVKEHVARVGLDPDLFAGHSLRAGFATSAAKKGVGLPGIMRQGRWKDQRVAMSYIRPATVLDDNATAGLGDEDE